jgi:hypothetical protein
VVVCMDGTRCDTANLLNNWMSCCGGPAFRAKCSSDYSFMCAGVIDMNTLSCAPGTGRKCYYCVYKRRDCNRYGGLNTHCAVPPPPPPPTSPPPPTPPAVPPPSPPTPPGSPPMLASLPFTERLEIAISGGILTVLLGVLVVVAWKCWRMRRRRWFVFQDEGASSAAELTNTNQLLQTEIHTNHPLQPEMRPAAPQQAAQAPVSAGAADGARVESDFSGLRLERRIGQGGFATVSAAGTDSVTPRCTDRRGCALPPVSGVACTLPRLGGRGQGLPPAIRQGARDDLRAPYRRQRE